MDKIAPKAPSKKAPVKAPVVSAKPVAKKTVAKPVKASPKTTAKPAVANTKPAAKKRATPKPAATSPKNPIIVSDEQRYRMVAEAAYYRAERNQFKSDPVRDWIDAESDIAALLNGVR